MNSYFIYDIIFLFIFITSINYLDVSATISDLFFNQIIFNETNMTMTNGTETFKNSTTGTCVMPECPSGKVCIQVCPESLPNI